MIHTYGRFTVDIDLTDRSIAITNHGNKSRSVMGGRKAAEFAEQLLTVSAEQAEGFVSYHYESNPHVYFIA